MSGNKVVDACENHVEMKQPRFNLETEMAIEEARLIMEGKIPAEHYTSTRELFDELEMDGE